ncbi:MAG: HD domain-containing protein [Bacteroidales bacterium]|mgnify:FL=1|jgi:GTP diphosphokinase / guanosine-3',5'-bis(diphosphate) 3'-diphosphatase|nr:HD domain-containing protein [Bacteroidales bacterium]MDG2081623.1 HD domain-containing protein [Bacteroidales bacterium]
MDLYNDLISAKVEDLLNILGNDIASKDRESVQKAFNISFDIYRDVTTSDGKPFILFNLDVAIIAVKEIGLGPTSAICALLHGIDKKSDYLLEDVEKDFGEHVAEIIIGFNSLSKLQTKRISFQSEKFRTMFLSMIDDMRVILIRLSHRLNDLRHLELLGDKLEHFISEAKYLYIPIAHRLGLYKIKDELEDRVMRHEQPDIYEDIRNKIRETKKKREVYINDFIRPIERELHANTFNFEIKWRTKSVPSIWLKMMRQNVPFEEVYDLFAIRIVLNCKKNREKEECWKVYSHVTNIYIPNPKRLRDWISTPKASGYESLHTTVKGHNDKWIEVQIRTERMDENAEKGQAAHWQYKGVMKKKDTENWLSEVRDILENPDQIFHDKSYKSSNSKKQESVFVFTPIGDLKQLPMGSTVLDFAFGIHTDVGAKCSGARINNKAVPIRYILKNGDKVDIITTKNQIPKHDWLSFVTTDKARTRIRKHLKESMYKEADIGKSALQRKLKSWKIRSNDDLIDFLVKYYKFEAGIDLYHSVATGKLDLLDIKHVLQNYIDADIQSKQEEVIGVDSKPAKEKPDIQGSKEILYVGENLKNVEYRMAKCCSPIQGDNVFGFITTIGGISIHRTNCPNAKRLREKYEYRVIDVKWIASGDKAYSVAILKITGDDELGVVGSISKVISDDLRVNMRSINFQTTGKRFLGKVTVSVRDYNHLEQLMAKINKVKGVDKVVRGK